MTIIDKLSKWLGYSVAWLTFIMVFATLYNVVSRYFFSNYSIPLGEAVIIMNAMVFLLSAPLLLYLDQHVRVDVFYSRFSVRKKAIVDCIGTILFLFPFCGFIIYFSWKYVSKSWELKEASSATGGLPALYLVKSLIILVAILMILQGLSMLRHKIKEIKHPELAKNQPHEEVII